ncbi:hypothetical protein LTR37_018393 [Vermiconidia calcicola]|uniref:Uncharacterized protein n=1 Tax=Vermiconidia calcicola TaxID=1690605 RepID=A0ACC3MI39_9PEZI|nr:hypothetical protein LTR37_018393 [Vermiconidia calcicola]
MPSQSMSTAPSASPPPSSFIPSPKVPTNSAQPPTSVSSVPGDGPSASETAAVPPVSTGAANGKGDRQLWLLAIPAILAFFA